MGVIVPHANSSANDDSDVGSMVIWEDSLSAFPSETRSERTVSGGSKLTRDTVDTAKTVWDADRHSIVEACPTPMQADADTLHDGDPLDGHWVPFTAIDGRLNVVPGAVSHRATEALTTDSAAEPCLDRFATLRDLNEIHQQFAAWQRLADQVQHGHTVIEDQRAAIDWTLLEVRRVTGAVLAMESQIAKLAEGHRLIASAEKTLKRSHQRASESGAQLEPVEKVKRGLRRELTRLETNLGILTASARRYREQLQLRGKAFVGEVQTLRMGTTRRARHRLAVTAGLLLAGFVVTGSFNSPDRVIDHARMAPAAPLVLPASALVLPSTQLIPGVPAMTTGMVTPLPIETRVRMATDGGSMYRGSLEVQSDPPGAAVFVNRRYVGETPVQLPRWRAGTHAVWVEQAGYQRWTRAVLVPADRVTRINAKLEVEPGG